MADASAIAPAALGAGADAMIAGGTPFGWFQAASPLIGKVVGGSGQGGPSRADVSSYTSASFNNSGWTVATGKAQATATPPLGIPWLLLAAAAVVGVIAWKRA